MVLCKIRKMFVKNNDGKTCVPLENIVLVFRLKKKISCKKQVSCFQDQTTKNHTLVHSHESYPYTWREKNQSTQNTHNSCNSNPVPLAPAEEASLKKEEKETLK